MIKWRLAEVMARHRIKGIDLAEYLSVRENAVSSLKNADTMPRIDGTKLNNICLGLTILSGEKITPNDLIEYKLNQDELAQVTV